MTQADVTDARGLSLSAASTAAVERFDALIDDLYYSFKMAPRCWPACARAFGTRRRGKPTKAARVASTHIAAPAY